MVYYENKRTWGIVHTCWFVVRTMGWGDEQDRFGSFTSSIRTEKVPPPRIIFYYAPIATAIRQARQARRRRFPCRRSAMLCPLCCFCRPALPEQGAKTIAYTWRKNKAESKHNGKAKAKKTSKAGKRHTLKRDHEKASKKGNRQHKQESLQACLLL